MSTHELALLSDSVPGLIAHVVILRNAKEHLLLELKLRDKRVSLLRLDIFKDIQRDISIRAECPTEQVLGVEGSLQSELAACTHSANE